MYTVKSSNHWILNFILQRKASRMIFNIFLKIEMH